MQRIIVLLVSVTAMIVVTENAQAVSFCLDNGEKAIYGPGGRYNYVTSSATFHGTWRGSPGAGGSVDVTFPNGRSRHDSFQMIGGKLHLINANGQQYAGHFCK